MSQQFRMHDLMLSLASLQPYELPRGGRSEIAMGTAAPQMTGLFCN